MFSILNRDSQPRYGILIHESRIRIAKYLQFQTVILNLDMGSRYMNHALGLKDICNLNPASWHKITVLGCFGYGF